jgi:hypothetical protein
MLIVTNFKRFPQKWTSTHNVSGEAIMVNTAWEILKLSRRADLIIINGSVKLTFQLAILYYVLRFLRRPILSHDIVLRKPITLRSRITAPIKKLLLLYSLLRPLGARLRYLFQSNGAAAGPAGRHPAA